MNDQKNIKLATKAKTAIPACKQGERLAKIVEPYSEISTRFSETFKPVDVFLNATRKQLAPLENGINEWSRRINDLAILLAPKINNFIENIDKYIELRKAEYLVQQAEAGWFIDPVALDALLEFLSTPDNETDQLVEAKLIDHFEARLDSIESRLSEMYPHRAHIFQKALAAHREEDYILSIPVFFAQVDGICFELSKDDKGNGKDYFRKNHKTKMPQISDYVDSVIDGFYNKIFIAPLKQSLPISESKRDDNFDQLNRHMVMHGESLDYGTKPYSLQALSLLNYVAVVFGEAVAEKNRLSTSHEPIKG